MSDVFCILVAAVSQLADTIRSEFIGATTETSTTNIGVWILLNCELKLKFNEMLPYIIRLSD